MTLTEQEVIDKIEILEDGTIQVRKALRVYKDGIEIAKTYHRHCLSPGDDYKDEDEKVKKVATVMHDKDTVDTFKAKMAISRGL